MQGPFFADYGVSTTFHFVLYTADGKTLQPSATIASGDVKINKAGTISNTSNLPVSVGNGHYRITLTAAELSADQITVSLDDATATETFLGTALQIVTFGNASGQVDFDLFNATPAVGVASSVSGSVGSVTGAVGSVTARVAADVDRVDGVALDAHDAGKFPSDVQAVNQTTFTGASIPATDSARISGSVVDTAGTKTTAHTDLDTGSHLLTTNNIIVGRAIRWLTGALIGLIQPVEAYNGSTGVVTFSEGPVAPSNTDTFELV